MPASSEAPQRIAVLITCHNRRERTLRCLRSLFAQECPHRLLVFLVDDASCDGTAAAVTTAFPTVRVIPGTGDLYWSGGMRLAHGTAAVEPHDFVLWLNDDVELYPHALGTMVSASRFLDTPGRERAIVVGALRDPHSGVTTYSGVVRSHRRRPMQFSPVEPTDAPRPCETMNGNVVLIPRAVDSVVGTLEPSFSHGISDFDYGLRARRHGVQAWVAPGHVGTCARNPLTGTWRDDRLPARQRWRLLLSPKGLPPRQWCLFTRRHGGVAWPLFWASPYLRLVLRLLVVKRGPTMGPRPSGPGPASSVR